ncbi:MAG: hypothetical protein IJW86_10395 [Clostridia bacterium]|nr:hypothetical protein [Clostridia bacterium]
MKKIISVILIAVISISAYKYYTENILNSFLLTSGSNKERIYDTVEKFEQSYNDGDFDSLLKCCTARFKSELKAEMKLGGYVGGKILSFFSSGLLGLDSDVFESMWSMGTEYCQMELDIKNIKYTSDSMAEVELDYIEGEGNNKKITRAFLEMKKENDAWCVASDFYEYSKM